MLAKLQRITNLSQLSTFPHGANGRSKTSLQLVTLLNSSLLPPGLPGWQIFAICLKAAPIALGAITSPSLRGVSQAFPCPL